MLAAGGAGRPQAVEMSVNFNGNTDTAFAQAFMRMVRNGQITIYGSAVNGPVSQAHRAKYLGD